VSRYQLPEYTVAVYRDYCTARLERLRRNILAGIYQPREEARRAVATTTAQLECLISLFEAGCDAQAIAELREDVYFVAWALTTAGLEEIPHELPVV